MRNDRRLILFCLFQAILLTFTSALHAQVQLTSARATELQARHDYKTALAEFERVTATATQYDELFDDPLVKKARATEDEAKRKAKP